jgi:hypothetical protein
LGLATALGLATGLGASIAGLAAIFTGVTGLVGLADDLAMAMAAFFLGASSLRVAFSADRTAGFELLADFECTCLLADLVAGDFVFVDAFVFTAALAEPPFDELAFAAKTLPFWLFSAAFEAGFGGFPFSGFPLPANFVFLAIGFDEDPLALFATTGLAVVDLLAVDLLFVPCFLAALTDVFFFDALANVFTNRC